MPKKKENRTGLKKIVEFDGIGWWEYTDFGQAPNQRWLQAQEATNFSERGLTYEKGQALFDLIKEKGNEGKFTEVLAVTTYFESLWNINFDEEALLQLACSYYVIDGEDHTQGYDLGIEEKKAELLRRNPEAKAFFLSLAVNLIKSLPKELRENIQNSIKEVRQTDLILSKILEKLSTEMQERFKELKSVYRGGSEKVKKGLKDIQSKNT